MDSDDQFWLGLWRVVGGVFCILTLTIGACDTYETRLKADMVLAGNSPVAVRCLTGDLSSSGMAMMFNSLAGKQ